MTTKLIYVELKTGYNDDGPAWIGHGMYNRTGKTLYFNGQVFSGSSTTGNHKHVGTGNQYWVSGVKKNGKDRRYAAGKIYIDTDAVADYKQLRGIDKLPESIYTVITFDKTINKESYHEIQNEPL